MKKKKIIKFSILVILIGYIVFKICYYYTPYKLGDIIDVEKLNTKELKIEFEQFNWMEDTRCIFTFEDYETNSKIIDYLKNKKVRRYKGIWTNRSVSSDAENYRIMFNNTYIGLLGSQYVDVLGEDIHCRRYKFLDKLDLTLLRQLANKKIKEVNSKRNSTSDIAVTNIFPEEPSFFWDYKSDSTNKYMMITQVTTTEASKILSIAWSKSDITNAENINNHVCYDEKFDLNMDNITHDETVLLKSPLKIGNTWKTMIPLKINDETHNFECIVNITDVNDDTVTTRLIIPNLNSFLDNQYIEETVYKKGLGIISKKFNAPNIMFKDITLGYELYGAYKDYPSDFISPEKLKEWGNELNRVYSKENNN